MSTSVNYAKTTRAAGSRHRVTQARRSRQPLMATGGQNCRFGARTTDYTEGVIPVQNGGTARGHEYLA